MPEAVDPDGGARNQGGRGGAIHRRRRRGRVPRRPRCGDDGEAKHPLLNGSQGSLYDVYMPMGMTAENVASRCGVSRATQDESAVISQSRAVQARDSGHFDAEIVPVDVPAHRDVDKEGNSPEVPTAVLSRDDGPRPGTTIEVLGQLKPAFRPDATVTGGNSCPLNDGAAAVPMMSEAKSARLGLTPLSRVTS